jgi:protoporphyrinogen oxidase
MKERVGIMAPGPRGGFGIHSRKYGFPFDVFEAEATVGGMARTQSVSEN